MTAITPIKPKENSELTPGVYKVEVVGGGGGGGGGVEYTYAEGGSGGGGERIYQSFIIFETMPYTLTIGGGGDGGDGANDDDGERGSDGGKSEFKIDNVLNVIARGGRGGGGAKDKTAGADKGDDAEEWPNSVDAKCSHRKDDGEGKGGCGDGDYYNPDGRKGQGGYIKIYPL